MNDFDRGVLRGYAFGVLGAGWAAELQQQIVREIAIDVIADAAQPETPA